jgi:hypothetical protein
MTIHAWLVRVAILTFMPPPRVAKLIDAGSTDLLEFYQAMTNAALQLSQSYGDLYHEKMAEALQVAATS